MSFLAPLYLLLGFGIAVPLLIHLLRRKIGTRLDFPAARYLARAEREHSRTLRLRNLLLMLMRVAALLAITVAAARPIARWVGAGHAPTAIAIVIDNSLSASAIVNGRPLLDQFTALARTVVANANAADRVWLVTADARVRGGNASTLREAIDHVEALAGAGDLPAALARAAGVTRASGLDARLVALLTDGQRTAWASPPPLNDIQILMWVPPDAPPPNRAVVLAEARPTRWTPRGAVAARVQSRDSTTYRMTLGGRTFARGTAAPNEEVVVHAAPPERGWVAGTVELEPDELTGDNARYFAARIGAAPGVSVSAGAGQFAKNGVDVLRASERVVDGRDITIVSADEALTLPALILAPGDPVKLGAANRTLERAGIPWRFGAHRTDAATVRGPGFDEVTVAARYDLVAQTGAAAETLAVVGRDAWIVAGPRYVLVGSPLTPDATSLPVRAAFLPWLAAMLTERLAGEPGQVLVATPGSRLARPVWADAIEGVDGARSPLAETIDVPARPGTYFLTRGDRRVGALVVNPPPEESNLERYTGAALADRLRGARTVVAQSPNDWSRLAFRAAARRSLIEPALIVALLLLAAEALLIGAGVRRPV